jgi:hypothetical protein
MRLAFAQRDSAPASTRVTRRAHQLSILAIAIAAGACNPSPGAPAAVPTEGQPHPGMTAAPTLLSLPPIPSWEAVPPDATGMPPEPSPPPVE